MVEAISREELREKLERGDDFALVETLTEPYYRRSHLPGAVNLPTEEVGERAGEVLPDRASLTGGRRSSSTA